jgi:hypothetical protein
VEDIPLPYGQSPKPELTRTAQRVQAQGDVKWIAMEQSVLLVGLALHFDRQLVAPLPEPAQRSRLKRH